LCKNGLCVVGEKEKKQGVILERNDVDEETLNIALRWDMLSLLSRVTSFNCFKLFLLCDTNQIITER